MSSHCHGAWGTRPSLGPAGHGQVLCPAATSTLDSALGFGAVWHSLSHPSTHGSIWEGQARTAALFKPPKMSLALVQGSAITMRWLFCGKCSPFSHTWSSLDTDKPSRLGFVMLHSLALLVKRTFLFSFWFYFLFLINSHVWQQYLFYKG